MRSRRDTKARKEVLKTMPAMRPVILPASPASWSWRWIWSRIGRLLSSGYLKRVAAAESLPWERAEKILAAPAAGIYAKMRIAKGLV